MKPLPVDLRTALVSEPANLDLRRVCADWYEENDQFERAEFIRVQCDLTEIGPPRQHLTVTPASSLGNGRYFVTYEHTPNCRPAVGDRMDLTIVCRQRERNAHGLYVYKVEQDNQALEFYNIFQVRVYLHRDLYSRRGQPERSRFLRERHKELSVHRAVWAEQEIAKPLLLTPGGAHWCGNDGEMLEWDWYNGFPERWLVTSAVWKRYAAQLTALFPVRAVVINDSTLSKEEQQELRQEWQSIQFGFLGTDFQGFMTGIITG